MSSTFPRFFSPRILPLSSIHLLGPISPIKKSYHPFPTEADPNWTNKRRSSVPLVLGSDKIAHNLSTAGRARWFENPDGFEAALLRRESFNPVPPPTSALSSPSTGTPKSRQYSTLVTGLGSRKSFTAPTFRSTLNRCSFATAASPASQNQPKPLPKLQSKMPVYLSAAVLAVVAWTAFIVAATNNERASSSVTRMILLQLKSSDKVQDFLGEDVRPVPSWFFRTGYIDGSINLMQGRVDIAFDVAGAKDKGRLYFTSVRPHQNERFQIIRWRIIRRSDAAVLDLVDGQHEITL